jgi:hypothetical protein
MGSLSPKILAFVLQIIWFNPVPSGVIESTYLFTSSQKEPGDLLYKNKK